MKKLFVRLFDDFKPWDWVLVPIALVYIYYGTRLNIANIKYLAKLYKEEEQQTVEIQEYK